MVVIKKQQWSRNNDIQEMTTIKKQTTSTMKNDKYNNSSNIEPTVKVEKLRKQRKANVHMLLGLAT
eukprot:15338577-Ditylum_brightwellii.AAC.1